MGGDVTSPTVPGPVHPRRHSLLAQDGIDKARFPRPGRSDERCGHSRADTCLNRSQTIQAKRTRRMDGNTSASTLDFSDATANVLTQVGLVEDHRGLGPAGPDSSEVSLDAVKAEVLVQSANHEDDIHIGGDDLVKGPAPRSTAGEYRSTRAQTIDDGRVLRSGWLSKPDPVTDCRQALTALPMAQPTCQPRETGSHVRPDFIAATMFGSDSCRNDGLCIPVQYLFLEKRAEVQSRQFVHDDVLHKRGVEPVVIAMAYVLNQPFPTFALFGPSTIDEMQISFKGLGLQLSPEELKWLNLED